VERAILRRDDAMKSPFTRRVLKVVARGNMKTLHLECGHSKELFGWVIPRKTKCPDCEKEQPRQPVAQTKRRVAR
jgi:hypothetical protein